MTTLVAAVAKKKTARVEFKADPEWVARMERAAARLGLDPSGYIRLAVSERMIRDGFDGDDEPQPPGKSTPSRN